jgi:hypothetical protein
MVNKYDHITSDEKMRVKDVLHRHRIWFSGVQVTCINILLKDLDLLDGANSYDAWACPILSIN